MTWHRVGLAWSWASIELGWHRVGGIEAYPTLIEDPQYIAQMFNDYFARIGHKMAKFLSDPPQKLPISR